MDQSDTSDDTISKLKHLENGKNRSSSSRRKSVHIYREEYVTWSSTDDLEEDNEKINKKKKKRKRKKSDADYTNEYIANLNKSIENSNEPKKGRGRPRKIKLEDDEEQSNDSEPKIKRGRGRPRKIIKEEEEEENDDSSSINKSITSNEQFEESTDGNIEGIFELSTETDSSDFLKEAQLSTTALQALGMIEHEEDHNIYQRKKSVLFSGLQEGGHFLMDIGNDKPDKTHQHNNSDSSNNEVQVQSPTKENRFSNRISSRKITQHFIGHMKVDNDSNDGTNTTSSLKKRGRPKLKPSSPSTTTTITKPIEKKIHFINNNKNKRQLKRQFNVVPDKWFTCEKCGTIFKFLSTYRYHTETDCNTNTVTVCSKSSTSSGGSHQTQYKCTECSKVVATRTSLMVHMRLHTGERPFKCQYCDTAFYQKHHLLDHVDKIHVNPKWFTCSKCSVKKLGYQEWKSHYSDCKEKNIQVFNNKKRKEIKEVDDTWKGKVYTCTICYKKYKTESDLNEHKVTHTMEEKKYGCDLCTRKFISKIKLDIHFKTHLGNIYPCKICGKEFTNKRRMIQHVARHEGCLSYSCKYCSIKFYSKYELKIHTRTHTDERPYPCPVCKRCFRRKSTMEVHLTIHTGIKPYKCHICNETFNRNSKLQIHILNIHSTNDDKFLCFHCNKSFTCKTYLIPHMRIHTGEKPFKCNICHIKYTRSGELKLHLKKNHINHNKNPYSITFINIKCEPHDINDDEEDNDKIINEDNDKILDEEDNDKIINDEEDYFNKITEELKYSLLHGNYNDKSIDKDNDKIINEDNNDKLLNEEDKDNDKMCYKGLKNIEQISIEQIKILNKNKRNVKLNNTTCLVCGEICTNKSALLKHYNCNQKIYKDNNIVPNDFNLTKDPSSSSKVNTDVGNNVVVNDDSQMLVVTPLIKIEPDEEYILSDNGDNHYINNDNTINNDISSDMDVSH